MSSYYRNRIYDPSNGKTYSRLKVHSIDSEKVFKDQFLRISKFVFPDFETINLAYTFNKASNKTETYSCDLIMIRKDLESWAIVEVELQDDRIEHAFDQISTFLEPFFDPDSLVKSLSNKLKDSDLLTKFKTEDLINLVKKDPLVILLIDEYNEKWSVRFKDLKGLIVLEINHYEFENNNFIYRIVGDYPLEIIFSSLLTIDSKDKKFFNIHEKGFEKIIKDKEIITLEFNGSKIDASYSLRKNALQILSDAPFLREGRTYRLKIANKNEIFLKME